MSRLWAAYGLTGNPFFQDPLGEGEDDAFEVRPLEHLFVGRAQELSLALRYLDVDQTTRTVITGEVGVGKTTFLNRLRKALAADTSRVYCTDVPTIRIDGRWSATDCCTEILRVLLLARTGRRVKSVPSSLWQQLQGVVTQVATGPDFWARVTQLIEGRQLVGVGVQGGTVGGQVQPGWAPPTLPPASLLLLTMDAIRVANAELGAAPVFFINNMENLSREDARHASGLFQDVRDLFLTPNAHWIVSGTPDIDADILRATPQVSGIFPTAVQLAPLSSLELVDLLTRRYTALRKGVAAVRRPVTMDDTQSLYALYRGDLRNFLRLLTDAVVRHAIGREPLPRDTIVRLMGREHLVQMRERLGEASFGSLIKTVFGGDPANPAAVWTTFRQTDAAQRAAMSSAGISPHVERWLAEGVIRPERREGRNEWVRLTGFAAVACASMALDLGGEMTPFITGREAAA